MSNSNPVTDRNQGIAKGFDWEGFGSVRGRVPAEQKAGGVKKAKRNKQGDPSYEDYPVGLKLAVYSKDKKGRVVPMLAVVVDSWEGSGRRSFGQVGVVYVVVDHVSADDHKEWEGHLFELDISRSNWSFNSTIKPDSMSVEDYMSAYMET